MITEFVAAFMASKDKLEAVFAQGHPDAYKDVVTAVITAISESGIKESPDPSQIYEIGADSHSGTAVYVIAENNFPPSIYWYVKIGYGTCGHCDTLERIKGASERASLPTPIQVQDYMSLALHIVQGLYRMGDDRV